ncbi:MAG: SAM-dependent methyltransferase [Actinomycetota bacterium]|nr:SAM-dependent methyltransferase [Actinomycetota bacterium]
MSSGGALAAVLERVRRFGPISFADYVDLALNHPARGFFSGGGGAGRDFLTSPEVGPLFGAVVARALDGRWDALGRPDPLVVVEAGAGAGKLAAHVLGARPRCASALRYVLVEPSEALRARQAQRLRLEPPASVLGPTGPGPADGDGERGPLVAAGPLATSLAELPAHRVTGVVLANELLDNLPFRLLERRSSTWFEVRVGEQGGRLSEVLVAAPPATVAEAERLAPDAPDGGRIPLQEAAVEWLHHALSLVERGAVVVFDYADTTASLARRPWPEWLRTYRGHARAAHPLEDPGGQDITCEVAVDQLARARPPSADRSQADFLRAHGLDQLAEVARAEWQERAHVGDLAALQGRSRLGEAAALTDPTGLGAFRVLEWDVP